MKEILIHTLQIMGWLGIVLGILALVNIVTGTLVNTWACGEKFNWKKMFKGIFQVLVFYVCAVCISIAFTILPFINEMIADTFGVLLLSEELLNTLSSVGVLGVVVSTIVILGKKAIAGVMDLAKLSVHNGNEIDDEDTEVEEIAG